MADETKKCNSIRKGQGYDRFLRGNGIDIGCGNDILDTSVWTEVSSVQPYDLEQGDANFCANLEDNSFDFVFSSHCLEHMRDPEVALRNWIRICKPSGHIVFCVPHEIFYEKCKWPSKYNTDHKTSWNLEFKSNMPKSVYVPEFLSKFDNVEVILAQTNLVNFNWQRFWDDQTRGQAICQIDVVLKKIS